MANYVITRIEASDGFDFTKQFKSFNDVLPMPKYVSKTTSGLVSRILEDGLKNNLALKEIVEPFRDYDTLKIEEFVFAYRAYRRTGFADWYDWSVENWGSKWDMDILHIEASTIEFQTPWNFPEPAIAALVKKYPSIYFTGEWAEYYSGEFYCSDSMLEVFVDADYSREACERYFSLWGGEEDYQLKLNKHNEYVYVVAD